MRVLLKLVLDCDPDAAWDAIRSPAVFREVSAPFTTFESLEQGGFPERWSAGEHRVRVKALGVVEVGEQVIGVSWPDASSASATGGGASRASATVRIMRDSGGGVSGPLALVTSWDHRMAISRAPGGGTLYRDQLTFSAGALTLALWPVYWAFWQWRGIRLRQLAPTWR